MKKIEDINEKSKQLSGGEIAKDEETYDLQNNETMETEYGNLKKKQLFNIFLEDENVDDDANFTNKQNQNIDLSKLVL